MPDIIRWPDELVPIVSKLAARLGHGGLSAVRELSGASGVHTYLCLPDGAHGRPNAVVVKVGPAEPMARDLAGLRLGGGYFRDANWALDTATTAGGLTAIPLRLAGLGAVTFEDLYRTEDSDRIVSVVDELFTDVLRLPDLTPKLTNRNVFTLYDIDDETRLARELREVGDEVPGLVDWWRWARSVSSIGSYSRLCHGDLHGRNVLVGNDPQRVYVVDFGQTGEHHALRDLAKLEREIHLSLLGASHAGRWTTSLLTASPTEVTEGSDPELVKAAAVVRRLRGHARRHLPSTASFHLEYGAALLAQLMFSAGNRALPMATRRAALRAAHGIQADLATQYPALRMSAAELEHHRRSEALWRFVYTFIRLDQQPAGNWARTIHGWMNAIWTGDEGQIYRDPEMRRRGGTDLTCYAMEGFVRFLRQHLSAREAAEVLTDNEVLSRAFQGLKSKIGFQGGSGTAIAGTAHADVKIRHTVMTVLAALRYRQGHDGAVGAVDVLRNCLSYLAKYLRHWDRDGAYPFGMAMACAKLSELLTTDTVGHLDPALVTAVRSELARVLPDMLEALESQPTRVPYLPPPKAAEVPRSPFFRPYCDFWRMERSGFIMYVGMAVQEDGHALIEPVRRQLGRRFLQCFNELLADVAPFDPRRPEQSLIRFHRGGRAVPRDWGLSAEFAALLAVPVIQDLIANGDARLRRDLDVKRRALAHALLATFDRYQSRPELFAFAQGAAIQQALHGVAAFTVSRDDLAALDASIDDLRNTHMTEWHLDRHIRQCIVAPSCSDGAVDVGGMRSLLVAKLESGEYIEQDAAWDQIADLAGSAERVTGGWVSASVPPESDPAVTQLRALLTGTAPSATRKALDVTDHDDGSYESHLRGCGLTVSVLGLPEFVVRSADGVDRPWREMPEEEFDVVTAGAAIMRVPRHRTPSLYETFHRVLRPGGLLLVSIRAKDHALIGIDGRFVSYYRDHRAAQALLRDAGFEIMHVIESRQPGRQGMDSLPYDWAHLFCRKPAS